MYASVTIGNHTEYLLWHSTISTMRVPVHDVQGYWSEIPAGVYCLRITGGMMSSLVHYPWMQGGERRSGPKEGEKVWGLGGGGGLVTSGRHCRCPLSCDCIME